MQFRDISLLALAAGAAAQTYTSCNPMEKTCPSDTGLAQSSYTVDFTKGASDDWEVTVGSVDYDDALGAVFTIDKEGDSPTLQSKWYIFFGSVTFYLRSATGTGIVSSAILQSDDLDEIDWEWLGGVPDDVQTNYFGKGNTTSYDRGTHVNVADGQGTFHKYTIDWTSTSTTWSIDGNVVRTLAYADALGGANYPQTPMNIRIGNWAGGDSKNSQGTIDWAGGLTDYSKGPYKMYLQKIEVTNANPGGSYTYSDRTGAYTSIKVDSSSDGTKNDAQESSQDASTKTGESSSKTSDTSSHTTDTPKSSNSSEPTGDGSSAAPTASGSGSGSATTGTSSSASESASSSPNAASHLSFSGVAGVLAAVASIMLL